MVKSGSEYQSDFAKAYYGQGRREERAHAVLAVLDARNVRLTKAARERILACSDLNELERWLRRAAVVEKAGEIFQEPAS